MRKFYSDWPSAAESIRDELGSLADPLRAQVSITWTRDLWVRGQTFNLANMAFEVVREAVSRRSINDQRTLQWITADPGDSDIVLRRIEHLDYAINPNTGQTEVAIGGLASRIRESYSAIRSLDESIREEARSLAGQGVHVSHMYSTGWLNAPVIRLVGGPIFVGDYQLLRPFELGEVMAIFPDDQRYAIEEAEIERKILTAQHHKYLPVTYDAMIDKCLTLASDLGLVQPATMSAEM